MSIEAAVALAKRRWPSIPVEVECDTLDQVKVAVEAGADLVLLDNMGPAGRGRRGLRWSMGASRWRCPAASRWPTWPPGGGRCGSHLGRAP